MIAPQRQSAALPLASGEAATRETGTHFLMRLYAALRVLRMYPIENERTQRALDELAHTAAALLGQEREVELRIAGEFLFVNAMRLRLGLDNYAAFGHVISTLRHCGVGTVHLSAGVTRRQWQVFLANLIAFAARTDEPEALPRLTASLRKNQVIHITVAAAPEGDGLEHDPEQKKAVAKRTYERSVGVTKALVNSARLGRAASLRKVKRAVQGIVDQVLNNETSIIGLTTIRDYDDYTFTHSVNVCIFSLAIGKRVGLTKLQLYDLGMAALLHDIGKSGVPIEVLNKSSSLSDDEWQLMRSHPWMGVLALFDLQGFIDAPFRSMIVAHQHHMKIDRTGYPRSRRVRALSMYSRLVTVADIFDAATSRRVYQTTPIQPDRILHEMMTKHDKIGVDLVLVKALINLLGIYPVGTCVILDTYELAIVHAANSDVSHIHRPIVRLLVSGTGQPFDPPPLADLTETDDAGRFARSIIKVVDPVRYGVNAQDYFV